MNMTTKATMGATIALLLVALFLALHNHTELKDARAENLRLKSSGGPAAAPASLTNQLAERIRAIEESTQAKDSEIANLQAQIARERAAAEAQTQEATVLNAHVKDQQKKAERALTPLQKKIKEATSIGEVEAVEAKWGFVTINAGVGQGVEKGIQFAVRREHYVIGRIKVDTVEENSAVANIVPKTIVPGFSIEPGDSVIAYPVGY